MLVDGYSLQHPDEFCASGKYSSRIFRVKASAFIAAAKVCRVANVMRPPKNLPASVHRLGYQIRDGAGARSLVAMLLGTDTLHRVSG
jgi:hypothetical protein